LLDERVNGMNLRFLTASESTAIDSRTNALSLFNVLEEILSPSFPVLIPKISIIALLERTLDEPTVLESVTLEIRMDQDLLLTTPMNIDFQGRPRIRAIVEYQGFVVHRPGALTFTVRNADEILGIWRINAGQIGPSEAQVFAAPQGEPLAPVGTPDPR
jgi:hypothetical protein